MAQLPAQSRCYDCDGTSALVPCHQAILQGRCQDRASLWIWMPESVLDDAGRCFTSAAVI